MTRAFHFAFVVALLATGGCDIRTFDVPKELAYVEANRDTFTDLEDHPLASIPIGAVSGDLADLEGCWGRATNFGAEGNNYAAGSNNYKVYRFDMAESSLTVQLLARRPFGLDAFVEHVYSAEVTSDNEMTVQFLTSWSDTTFSDFGDEPREHEDSEPFRIEVTLYNDAFKFGESTDPPGGPTGLPLRQNEVFLRFDCPE